MIDDDDDVNAGLAPARRDVADDMIAKAIVFAGLIWDFVHRAEEMIQCQIDIMEVMTAAREAKEMAKDAERFGELVELAREIVDAALEKDNQGEADA